MSESRLIDADARRTALDPGRSFIVQAPAGSGKTSLLIQRFLALLATVGAPEEIVAITFTRKAAAEMRERIMQALEHGAGDAPDEDWQRTTWTLARAVLERDADLDWGLALNPARLRLMTIDALNAALVRQMPMLSNFGASPQIASRPKTLYRLAARRVLAALEDDPDIAASVEVALAHLDNNLGRVEDLVVEMLAKRDNWLRHVAGHDARPELSRAALEAVLTRCREDGIAAVRAALPDDMDAELVELAAYAASRCQPESPLRACIDIEALPEAAGDGLDTWLGLRHLLLTQSGGARRTISAKDGFLAQSGCKEPEKSERKAMKARHAALTGRLDALPELVRALHRLDELPPARYHDDDWRMLQALLKLLTRAATELTLVFQEAGSVDYAEVAHRALAALGDDDAPTDLALQLDYRLRHLLVDEFQDTSATQAELLTRLVAGWEPGDGRTLFVVGDPMQSIYRFREADVGLFLLARRVGIGGVPLEPLQLQANFRSRPELVEFCNRTFSAIFPAVESIADSAVAFASSQAQRTPQPASGVTLHAFAERDAEAPRVVEIVREVRGERPEATVAILVRSRTHLVQILPALHAAGISYRATDIDRLKEQGVVSDLWALTRALLHLGDRTAWLTLLRAPWCGLSLADLHALVRSGDAATVWEATIRAGQNAALSGDGRLRLTRVKGVIASALAEKGRRDLRRWVEGTWIALGGPACIATAADRDNADAFLNLLEAFENDGGFDDLEELALSIEDLFAQADSSAGDTLQIMTMHKAKGLEFDMVIVPGLDRRGVTDRRGLLDYLRRTGEDGLPEFLLAPIHATGQQDAYGKYIRQVAGERDRLEQLRLLYVAATRARERLHLMMRLEPDDAGEPRQPVAASLGARLWPALERRLRTVYVADLVADGAQAATAPPPLRRVPSAWMLPQAPQPEPWRSTEEVFDVPLERQPEWAGDTARHVGTTVHRVLQQVATEGVERWRSQWMDGLDSYLGRMLAMLGVSDEELADATTHAQQAIEHCLGDQRARWLLSDHACARAELPLTSRLDGRLYNVVLDRTFVDEEEGVRWIVDYKTGAHDGGDVDAYLDEQVTRYRGQLELYARIMHRYDARPIRLGLYFPMLQGWREWTYVNRRLA